MDTAQHTKELLRKVRLVELKTRGFRWAITLTGEAFALVDGGVDDGIEAQLLFDAVLDADLETLAGWTGAKARVNPMWIEGHGLTRERVGDLTLVSNIDAPDGVRVFEAWLEQAVGPVSARAGVLAVDQDFVLSELSALFVNGTFGLPILLTQNAAFSAYPLGALGARVQVEPVEGVYVKAGLFEGSPDDPARNRSGLEIRLHDDEGLLYVAEAGWRREDGLLKAGAYGGSDDAPHGLYGVVEQSLLDGLSLFARGGLWASERRSTITRYGELGAVYAGFRDQDAIGLAFVWAKLSDAIPDGRYEAVVELTYKCVILPWLIAQPDVQWIRHPGGLGEIDDATIVGLRVDVLF